jgi:uncharacterized membrane protein YeiH
VRDRILIALDLLGTFLFAIEGSAVAVAANFDVFGVALRLTVPQAAATALGIAVCFGLRVLAYVHHWNLPNANA